MKTYLPELSISEILNAVESQEWEPIAKALEQQQYERLGLDRALAIALDIFSRHESLKNIRVLDVGCNNGLLAKILTALGCYVVGIDNGDVDNQGIYTEIISQTSLADFEFHQKDLADFLKYDTHYWDCVLLLSVTHHWETGYAMTGKRRYSDLDIRILLRKLFERTRSNIYYECPSNEPGFEAGFGINFLFRYCNELPKIRSLGNTIGPNGYLRQLLALDMEQF